MYYLIFINLKNDLDKLGYNKDIEHENIVY